MLFKLLCSFLYFTGVIQGEVYYERAIAGQLHIIQISHGEQTDLGLTEFYESKSAGEICHFLSFWVDESFVHIFQNFDLADEQLWLWKFYRSACLLHLVFFVCLNRGNHELT